MSFLVVLLILEIGSAENSEMKCGKGDINGDGLINFKDVNLMKDIVNRPEHYRRSRPDLFWLADINGDGRVNGNDINPFAKRFSR